MIILCCGEDFIYSITSAVNDVIMTSNRIYDIIEFSSALLKTQMALREKNSFRTFSDLHFKETRLGNMSNKKSRKK